MRVSSLAVAALAALGASARPTTGSCPAPQPSGKFGVIAIRSGSGVHLQGFSAALNSLFAGYSDQNAECERPDEKYATFYIENGDLYLYTPEGAEKQQFFVDRSGMGQGKIGYTTGDASIPRYGERTGWSIDANNHLKFDGKDFIACPNGPGRGYSIWADAGVENPGFNEGCVGIAARVQYKSDPNACVYSSPSA
ncbi:hypothetical protein VTO42DRAFT_2398 [Malbranchea cinnamomea]